MGPGAGWVWPGLGDRELTAQSGSAGPKPSPATHRSLLSTLTEASLDPTTALVPLALSAPMQVMEIQRWAWLLPGQLGQVQGFEVGRGGWEGQGSQGQQRPECPHHSEPLGRRPVLPKADSEPPEGLLSAGWAGPLPSVLSSGGRAQGQRGGALDPARSQLPCSQPQPLRSFKKLLVQWGFL